MHFSFGVKVRIFQIAVLLQFLTKRLETKAEGVILAMSINPPIPIDERKI